ncbi:enoyl-CoA hydratase/isomerase family protein [Nitrobacteraceae bacterium UC4446_H13]
MKMTDDSLVRVTLSGSAMQIELNRPRRGNALSAPLVEVLMESLAAAESNTSLDTVVLRGAGRHFCTGFDLEGIEQQSDGDLLHRFVRIETLLSMIWGTRLRTIAIGSGRTWGAGADLFTACDVRIAPAECRFRFPGAGFGLVLGTRRLAVRVGEDKARLWTTTGIEFTFAEAVAAGLVTHVPDDDSSVDAVLGNLPALSVDALTLRGLNAASRRDESERDLALLTRSASRPGLKNRILTYAQGRQSDRDRAVAAGA